jgi:tripartite-type tricarboxylate transporter receptor subunit TctC
MFRRMCCLTMGFMIFGFNIDFALASSHDFFKGKTVRIVVGLTAGGAFDIYARALARHLGKHIRLTILNHRDVLKYSQ